MVRWIDGEDRMVLVRELMLARRVGRDLGESIAFWIQSFVAPRLSDLEVEFEQVQHNLLVTSSNFGQALSISLGKSIEEIVAKPYDCQFEFLFISNLKIVAVTESLEAAIDWMHRCDPAWRRRVANRFLTTFQDYLETEERAEWAVSSQRTDRTCFDTSPIYIGPGYYQLHFKDKFKEVISIESYAEQFDALYRDLQCREVYLTTWIAPFQLERPVSLGIFKRMVFTANGTVPKYSEIEEAVTDVDGDVILRRAYQGYRDRIGSLERLYFDDEEPEEIDEAEL